VELLHQVVVTLTILLPVTVHILLEVDMAHFAKLDQNNVVLEVNVVNNSDIQNLPFPESEPVGIAFLVQWSNGYPYWKQTSYNGNIRKNYAGIGYTYDAQRDAFIPPKPFDSWVLNEETCLWDAPTPMPQDGKRYRWDEPTTSWIEVQP
jgi:hypothetical protein